MIVRKKLEGCFKAPERAFMKNDRINPGRRQISQVPLWPTAAPTYLNGPEIQRLYAFSISR
jgi:hypothetical protein